MKKFIIKFIFSLIIFILLEIFLYNQLINIIFTLKSNEIITHKSMIEGIITLSPLFIAIQAIYFPYFLNAKVNHIYKIFCYGFNILYALFSIYLISLLSLIVLCKEYLINNLANNNFITFSLSLAYFSSFTMLFFATYYIFFIKAVEEKHTEK